MAKAQIRPDLGGAAAHAPPLGAANTRPARILIYGMNYAPELTGVGRSSGEIGAYLSQQGLDVEVVTTPPHYPGWALRDGYANRYAIEHRGRERITRCPMALRKDMRGIWRLLAPLSFALSSAPVAVWRILTTRPNTVLCVEPTLFSAPIALAAAKLVRARTVLHVQDLEIDAAFAIGHLHSAWLKAAAFRIERVVLRGFDAVVTLSGQMRSRLVAKGVAASRLQVVRNGVDLSKIVPLTGENRFRRELDLPASQFVVLYAGSIGAKQALPLVIDAAGQLTKRPDITFVIAGDGPAKAQLVDCNMPNVLFLPLQPEERLCELLSLADAHVLPQDPGIADLCVPGKLGGMLASGRNVIVMTDAGTELHDFLSGVGIIVPTGDVLGVVAAILELSASHDRTRGGEKSRALSEKLSHLGQLSLLLKVLLPSSALAHRPSPSDGP